MTLIHVYPLSYVFLIQFDVPVGRVFSSWKRLPNFEFSIQVTVINPLVGKSVLEIEEAFHCLVRMNHRKRRYFGVKLLILDVAGCIVDNRVNEAIHDKKRVKPFIAHAFILG